MQITKDLSSVALQWQRRLYDTRGNAHPNARSRHNVRQKFNLDMQRHCSTVDVADWKQLLSHIADRKSDALCGTVNKIASKAKQFHQSLRERLEVRLILLYVFVFLWREGVGLSVHIFCEFLVSCLMHIAFTIVHVFVEITIWKMAEIIVSSIS